jgi:glycosyltransferase involved in cell wall biosynthesis
LLEAMSTGVPVAVTNVGGNVEIVADGVNGWIVNSNADERLARVFEEASRDPGKRLRLADEARRSFEDRFTFELMMSAYRSRYRELVSA